MPSKRSRKDSERSTGSSGAPCTHGVGNAEASICGGSTSSGSVADDCENAALKTCCFVSCSYGEASVCDEKNMVKLICSNDGCPTSQFMHSDCFNHWEETLLGVLRTHGRARSWSEKQRRQNLWTKKGYDLVFRACTCRCKHGHLRKDLDWAAVDVNGASDQDGAACKKKNRKKKDLPTLGNFNGMVKSKSKPIPNGKDNRMRHSSASSIVSIDQGYISASPGTGEMGPSVFSPPSHYHHRPPFFSVHNTNHSLAARGSCSFHAPSTSPLPEIPDDNQSNSNFTLSSTSTNTSPVSPVMDGLVPPTLSLESEIKKNPALGSVDFSDYCRQRQRSAGQPNRNEVQAMSMYIDSLMHQDKANDSSAMGTSTVPSYAGILQQRKPNGGPRSRTQIEQAFTKLSLDPLDYSRNDGLTSNSANLPSVPFSNPTVSANFLEECQRRNAVSGSWANAVSAGFTDSFEARNPGTDAKVLFALRQKEKKEMENREQLLMNVVNAEERKAQILAMQGNRLRTSSHTEIRLVPMRTTIFAKRYDFSAFQEVLARQHINPYHIKMEGEGYGSDDLRNFILASLSKERCSKMNCVLCNVELPIYDHFPLIDGTMFMSPEKNEQSTKYSFKIKMEGKYEYVHAACIRCMEGLHNIVCRMCNTRWEGTYHQLGSLYMFDIFAARPCCQKRLCCKQCGRIIVDIRQGLNFFSDYSGQKTCPHCRALDYHFVHPVTSYQLVGLVYS